MSGWSVGLKYGYSGLLWRLELESPPLLICTGSLHFFVPYPACCHKCLVRPVGAAYQAAFALEGINALAYEAGAEYAGMAWLADA